MRIQDASLRPGEPLIVQNATPLIRTGYREKLPRGLSHRVGAEVISRALVGCPQYDALWTAFSRRSNAFDPAPPGWDGFRRAFAVVLDRLGGSCYLSVPAIPSNERAFLRQLLTSAGLAKVRAWEG